MLLYQSRLKSKNEELKGLKYTKVSKISFMDKSDGKLNIHQLEQIFNTNNFIPEYMHKLPTNIVFIGSNWQIRKIRIKGYVRFLKQLIKTKNLYKCLDEEIYTLPFINEDTTGITMRECDSNGNSIIYLYLNNLYDPEYGEEELKYNIICVILHELYHVYQRKYWKRFKEFDSYYCCTNLDTLGGKAYYMNELEVSAREWSLSRINYATGEKLIYVNEK